MTIRITGAGPEDAPALARIHLAARAAAGDAFPPPVHAPAEYLPHLLADVLPAAEVRVARDGAQVVGFLVLEGSVLADLYVAPEVQGGGVGSALLHHAKALRPGGLTLWVFVSNGPARAFYERRGFVAAGGTDGDNEEGAPDLLLRWPPATP
jgi:GNAT superfamily N-acetyltransferase